MRYDLTALIIDQDEQRQSIVQALQESGYRVIEATETTDGLRYALEESPNLVVLGESMPPIGRSEILPLLRRITDAPIVMVGRGGEWALVAALLAGADVYLAQPVNIREFLARVNALLRRYGAARGPSREPRLHC